MSERLNGGPFTLAPGQQIYLEYWWGKYGDDHHLAYAAAHPLDPSGANLVSFDQRALLGPRADFQEGDSYTYGVTVRNDRPPNTNPSTFDVYATTP